MVLRNLVLFAIVLSDWSLGPEVEVPVPPPAAASRDPVQVDRSSSMTALAVSTPDATSPALVSRVSRQIPASFVRGPGHDAMSLSRARALVSSRPDCLLGEYSFNSRVNRVDAAEYGIKASDVVADVGCGTGALECKLLRENVRFRRLYAVDVNRDSLDFLRFALATLDGAGLGHEVGARVATVHSKREDACLPPSSIDVMILFNTPIGGTSPDGRSSGPPASNLSVIRSLGRALRPTGVVHYVLFCRPQIYSSVRSAFEGQGLHTLSEKLLGEGEGEGESGIQFVFVPPSHPSGSAPRTSGLQGPGQDGAGPGQVSSPSGM